MSDKDYKGKKGGDDYKPLTFYQERISGIENGFDSFSDGELHYFTYNIDGQVVLISESYSSVSGRDNGIKSVDKNRLLEARYKLDSLSSGKHFFNLVAGNHQEIATSAWFESEAAMNIALARLMEKGSQPITGIVGARLSDTESKAEPIMVGKPAAAVPAVMPQPSASATDIGSTPVLKEEDDDKPSAWWWLFPLVCFLFVWLLFSQCCQSPAEATDGGNKKALSVGNGQVYSSVEGAPQRLTAEDTVASKNITSAALGAFFISQLPNGVQLNIPERGVENKLIAFIEDDRRPADKTTWFNFDRINFATGSARLSESSKEQIQNITAILESYPDVELKIGGYTDNTGSLALNQRLSQERAASVMNALIAEGVALHRLEAEGYGPKHPVATNDTAEGRAKNRRIALRVTQK